MLATRSVGSDIRQHRRHVGTDHTRAFGDSCDRHVDAVDYNHLGQALGPVSVVMIARAASFPAAIQSPAAAAEIPEAQLRQRQPLTDHAGRERQDRTRRYVQAVADPTTTLKRIFDTQLARRCIRVAAVDQNRA